MLYTAEPPDILNKEVVTVLEKLRETRTEAGGSNDSAILSVKTTQALAENLGG